MFDALLPLQSLLFVCIVNNCGSGSGGGIRNGISAPFFEGLLIVLGSGYGSGLGICTTFHPHCTAFQWVL